MSSNPDHRSSDRLLSFLRTGIEFIGTFVLGLVIGWLLGVSLVIETMMI